MPSETRNTYVGMFDILGFKALRASRGTTGIAQLYERSLLAMIQHSAAGASVTQVVDGQSVLVPHFTETSVAYQVISDTVIFLGRDDTFDSFFAIVRASYDLLVAGFGNGQTPFRGAIGFGDLYNQGQVVVGSAVEDAYVAESSQLWAGTMFTTASTEHAQKNGYFERWVELHRHAAEAIPDRRRDALLNAEKITWYHVPLKPDGEPRYAPVLDWTLRMYEGAATKALPPSNNENATAIRSNTIAFEDWARAKRR